MITVEVKLAYLSLVQDWITFIESKDRQKLDEESENELMEVLIKFKEAKKQLIDIKPININ